MANIITGDKNTDFWVLKGTDSIHETLDGVISQVGDLLLGIGNVTTHFTNYKFDVGNLTYTYVGDWVSKVVGNGLSSTTTLSGIYDKIIVEKNGQFLSELDLDKALKVNFGKETGINLLGLNLSDLVNPLLKTLIGDGVDLNVANLHLKVNPELEDLLNVAVGGGDIPATGGDDTINGSDNDDDINGLGGNDTIHGKGGNDTIHGGDGDDKIWGDGGNDKLYGDDGNDKIWGGQGNDLIHGGRGNDQIWGNGGRDRLYGDAGNDIIRGGAGNDRLWGGAGNDKLYGNAGNDKLVGGAGNDLLVGGKGRDILIGGKGSDTFDFNLASESKGSKHDVIKDFSHAQRDHIDLSTIDANSHKAGNQAFDFIGTQQFHHTEGELRYVKAGGETMIQGDINGDGKADFTIELDSAMKLHASDFIL